MITDVLFDVDGVLVRSGVFGSQLVLEHGFERSALQAFWLGPFVQCSLGLADLKVELEHFLQLAGKPGTADAFLAAWLEADSELNSPALEHVRRLRARNIRCHVASTQEAYRAAYLETAMGLGAHFDQMFLSCRLGVRKPQPEFFERITEMLAVPSGALLLLDDQVANVEAARQAGWNAELCALDSDFGSLLARHGLG